MKRILIIKHGALGDIILCTGVLKTIRHTYPDADITLLTTKPFVSLFEQSGYVDNIWVDSRPKYWQVGAWMHLAKKFRSISFDHVYDLQTSNRSSLYYHLFPSPKPEFSGIAKGASHCHDNPKRTHMHTIDRHKEQMRIAGIDEISPPDISWMKGSAELALPHTPYALLVPGGSAHRPEKRYPKKYYIALCALLIEQNITPILIGNAAEVDLLDEISLSYINIVNLCNKTSLNDIAELARHATYAIGNDTGPMHIIAAVHCRCVILFSHASNPDLCAPRGEHVSIIRSENLQDIPPDDIMQLL